jgi:Zn finger protein HypA/HybF involved in hydrogenase expression
MIRKLIGVASDEAARQGGALRAIHVRLGALSGGSPDHMREHFDIELERLGLDGIVLHIESAPDHPAGVEITSIEIAK